MNEEWLLAIFSRWSVDDVTCVRVNCLNIHSESSQTKYNRISLTLRYVGKLAARAKNLYKCGYGYGATTPKLICRKIHNLFCNLHISNVTTAATVDSRLAMYKKCFLRLVVIIALITSYYVLHLPLDLSIQLDYIQKKKRAVLWYGIP